MSLTATYLEPNLYKTEEPMDPISTASSFATIVSLLADYVSQRTDVSADEYKAFTSWLAENRHDELIASLERHQATTVGIKAILNSDRELFLSRFDKLDSMFAAIATTSDGFSALAESFYPNSQFSEQCIDILRQLDTSGGSSFMELPMMAETVLMLIDGGQGNIEIKEPRFMKDDLNTLVAYGFLSLTHNSSGKATYGITRRAVAFLKMQH